MKEFEPRVSIFYLTIWLIISTFSQSHLHPRPDIVNHTQARILYLMTLPWRITCPKLAKPVEISD